MSNKTQIEAKLLSATMLLSFGMSMVQATHAANAKSQADVDAVKTSKDDNQTQIKSTRNAHKQGTPLPFEGPPAKSGKTGENLSAPNEDKKP